VSTSSTSAPKEAKATSKQAAGGDVSYLFIVLLCLIILKINSQTFSKQDDYAEKKSSPIAKSNVIYDIKP
jgi:hypothetical protein